VIASAVKDVFMNLDELRTRLSAVDRKLVDLIAERQQIVGEIGKNKLVAGTGTRDYAREKDVLDMGRAQAVEAGVDPDLVETLLQLLIRTSLESQERDRVIAEGLLCVAGIRHHRRRCKHRGRAQPVQQLDRCRC
jgi:chorismate mutase